MNKPEVAVLVGPQYEELEFWYPVLRFREEGMHLTVLGIDGSDTYYGRARYPVTPDRAAGSYEGEPAAVVIPGLHGDAWRHLSAQTSELLRSARRSGAVLAAISSGVVALADAGLLDGVTVACGGDGLTSTVAAAGGKPSSDRVTHSSSIVTARSVEDVTVLMQQLLADLHATA